MKESVFMSNFRLNDKLQQNPFQRHWQFGQFEPYHQFYNLIKMADNLIG